MTDMTKRREQLEEKYGNASPALIGFDIAVAEMQAQVDGLMKSNKEMSDLIYSEDGYIASQDSLVQERDTLKQKLEIAVKALEKIRSGITTQQDKVEFYTKKEAHETLVEIQKMRGSSTTTKLNGESNG